MRRSSVRGQIKLWRMHKRQTVRDTHRRRRSAHPSAIGRAYKLCHDAWPATEHFLARVHAHVHTHRRHMWRMPTCCLGLHAKLGSGHSVSWGCKVASACSECLAIEMSSSANIMQSAARSRRHGDRVFLRPRPRPELCLVPRKHVRLCVGDSSLSLHYVRLKCVGDSSLHDRNTVKCT